MRVASLSVLTFALAASGAPTGATAASAPRLCRVPSPYTGAMLISVAATSSRNAWAVGTCTGASSKRTLTEHWSGRVWKRVPSPNPGGRASLNYLDAVAADSGSDAWAVGQTGTYTAPQTLAIHWNGRAWERTPTPDPGGRGQTNILQGVAALTGSDAWAVGYANVHGTSGRPSTLQTLILHWNGKKWRRVPSPDPAGSVGSSLTAVSASSRSNAWAVGWYGTGTGWRSLTLRWNGRAWKRAPSPSPSRIVILNGVASVSRSDAWAVGWASGSSQTLIEHWDGKTWTLVPSPDPAPAGDLASLASVAAVSRHSAWAVGAYQDATSSNQSQTLILRWNGKVWTQAPSPNPGGVTAYTALTGLAVVSPSEVWAVGQHYVVLHHTLIVRWNGRAWKRTPSP